MKTVFGTLKGRSLLEKPQGWILSAALYTAQQESTAEEVPFELSHLFHPYHHKLKNSCTA